MEHEAKTARQPLGDLAQDRRAARGWLLALPLAIALGWAGVGDLVLHRPEPLRPAAALPAEDGLPGDLLAGHAYRTSFTVDFPSDWPVGNHPVVTATWGAGSQVDLSVCSETVEGVAGRSVTLPGCELSFGQEGSGVLTLLVLPSGDTGDPETPRAVTRSWNHRVVPAAGADAPVEDARRLCGDQSVSTPPQPLFGPRRAVVDWAATQVATLRCEGVLPKLCIEPLQQDDLVTPNCVRSSGDAAALRAYLWAPGVLGVAPLGTARVEATWQDGTALPVALSENGTRLFSAVGPVPVEPAAPVSGELPRMTVRAYDTNGRLLVTQVVGVCDTGSDEPVDPVTGTCSS